MSGFIISLGLINKKLYFPIIYIIIKIITNICWIYVDYNLVSLYISTIGISAGQISSFLVSKLMKYHKISPKKKEKVNKQYIKDYLFLFLILLAYNLTNITHVYFGYDEEKPENSYTELYINDAIDIIFITLATHFILKYKYYIHHMLSIALFVVLSSIIDLLVGNFKKLNLITVLFTFFYVLTESLFYSYIKYLNANKYYFFMNILLFTGIFNFVFFSLSFLSNIIINIKNGDNEMIFEFYFFLRDFGLWKIIFLFAFSFILDGFASGIIEYATIKELTPNYAIIGYELSKIPFTIKDNEGVNRWIILVISIFQIISLLFYLEILEYNFCSLNKNTKKNIMDREKKETFDDNNSDNEIVIKGYDITENIYKDEKMMEIPNI